MDYKEFKLERWLPYGSRRCEYNLGGASPPMLRFKDVMDNFDLERTISYGYTKGSDELREKIAELYPSLDKENIVVTHGACEANFLLLNHLLNKGDRILIVVPTYLGAYGVARTLGAEVRLFHLKEEEDYNLDLEKFKEALQEKIKTIFITNPGNPIGTKLSKEEVKSICEIAEDSGAHLIFDEALHGLEIDGISSPSPVEFYDKGITTRSISKLGFGGLRIGWIAVANKEIVEGCWAIKDYTTLGTSGLNEHLTTIALSEENLQKILEKNRENLRVRLKILEDWLAQNKEYLSLVPIRAGAAVFPRYEANIGSIDLAEKLLKKEQVLISPGDYFLSPRHFRMNYGGHTTTIDETTFKTALNRLSSFLRWLA